MEGNLSFKINITLHKNRIFGFSKSRYFSICYIIYCDCMFYVSRSRYGICECHLLCSHNFSSSNIYSIKYKTSSIKKS